jgi:hypothetical protein
MEKYNDDLKRRQNTYASDLENQQKGVIQKYADLIRTKFAKGNPADVIITDDFTDIGERVERAAGVVTNSLFQWQQLLAPFKARLSFVLQPMSYWTKDDFTEEEREIFHAIDSCPNNFWRLFSKILSREVHERLVSGISEACSKRNISFFDMNHLLRGSSRLSDYLFVDRVHFNDIGYDEVARMLCKTVIS